MCAGSPGGGMRVTEARGKESVFNGASRGRRYGGRRIERRPTAHLAFARGGGDDDASRIIKKKVGYLPNQSKGTFWCGFVWAKTRLIRSTKKDVSSSSSCLPCKFWNEPPLDFFMAPLSSSSSFSSKVVLLRLVWRLLLFNTFCFWDEMFSRRGLFSKNKNKKMCMV